MKNLLVPVFISLAALVISVGGAATPASAAGVTYNYIVMPTWQGNCPGGGSVTYVAASSFSASTSATAADGGDDIVYLRVGLNENVTVAGNVRCTHFGITYNGPAVSVTIRPTRLQQSWYIGPNGVSHN
ncbi:hypothetical protein AB0J83_28505 [Actinoplanes sp. NPDC049596]|uniref:hypothetical protein n=1 Tax=unclassified Actinoplanes TaxID=2626549 RepID=UPI0034253A34